MSSVRKALHICPECGHREWLVRRPGGKAWELAHRSPDDQRVQCAGVLWPDDTDRGVRGEQT